MPRGTQMINGVEYVFETKAKWNPDKKYGTHSRRYIGKMVDGVFVPQKSLDRCLQGDQNGYSVGLLCSSITSEKSSVLEKTLRNVFLRTTRRFSP